MIYLAIMIDNNVIMVYDISIKYMLERNRKNKNNMSSSKIDSEKLIKLRKKALLSQTELAEKSGVGRFTISRMEREKDSSFIGKSIRGVSKALNVDPEELLKSEED